MQILDRALLIHCFLNFVPKYFHQAFTRLPLPRANLRRLHLILGCNLLNRLITVQRFTRHSSLRFIRKVPPICHSRIHSLVLDTFSTLSNFAGSLQCKTD